MARIEPFLRELYISLVIFQYMEDTGEITDPMVKGFIHDLGQTLSPMIPAATRVAWKTEVAASQIVDPL